MLSATVELTLFVLLVAILSGPILAARLRVPGLLALIFLGMAFGPFGLGWLGRVDLVFDLGAIGILYLMFLAGLGFNLNAFAENRTSALVFGFLSFIFPFGFSLLVGITAMELGILGAALVGSMWASNTLVAYPDVKAAGLEGTRAVRDAVSAGVVADVLSLLVLAVATSYAVVESVDPEGPTQQAPDVPLLISLLLLAGFTLWVLPRLGRWFFVRVGWSRVQRVLFALAAMAAAAGLAVAGGLEGIIGAFLAGIGLNRLVPKDSELMERIDFIGSSVFIPAFLVSIGLRIDPAALVDPQTVVLGLVFTGLLVAGKAVAVLVAAFFFRYSFDEGGLITSLSLGQAASTLAIGQIGLELGLFDQEIVNASVLTIVIAALLTSFGTQFFIRRVPAPTPSAAAIGERTLVDVRSAGSDLTPLVQFAGLIARGDDGIAIPFVVATRGQKEAGRQQIVGAEAAAQAGGYDWEGVVRLSDSVADGTLELVEETDASLVVLAWKGPRFDADSLFGSDLATVVAGVGVPTVAVHLLRPWDRVIVVPGASGVAWHDEQVRLALTVAGRLRDRGDLPLVVIADDRAWIDEHLGSDTSFQFVQADLPGDALVEMIREDDLVVVPAYLLPDMPMARRLRLAASLGGHNLAVVAGPGQRLVGPISATRHATEQLLGPRA